MPAGGNIPLPRALDDMTDDRSRHFSPSTGTR